jgi:prepilin-type N-terminal cleavage/methylation domain-containing protein
VYGSERGFTLVETLVALVIFAAALMAAYQSFSAGRRGYQVALAEAAALSFAQSRMAAAGVEIPLAEGHLEDRTEEGLTWTIDIRRYGQPLEEQSRSAQSMLEGYWVTVEVSWREGRFQAPRRVSLTALKLRSPL